MSEKEALRKLEIRKLEQALARKNALTITTTNNDNSVWKTVGLVFFGIIGLGCLTGIAYLIGQNSVKNNRCKC